MIIGRNYLNKKEKEQIWKIAAFISTLESIIETLDDIVVDNGKLLKWLKSSRTFAEKAIQEYIEGKSEKEVRKLLKEYKNKEFYIK